MVTYSQTLTALKMAVVQKKYSEDQSIMVQQAVLGEVWKCKPGTGPQFKNSYADKGIVNITCADKKAKEWLTERIPHILPWEGGCSQDWHSQGNSQNCQGYCMDPYNIPRRD